MKKEYNNAAYSQTDTVGTDPGDPVDKKKDEEHELPA